MILQCLLLVSLRAGSLMRIRGKLCWVGGIRRSKHFRLVSEQRKTEERDFRF